MTYISFCETLFDDWRLHFARVPRVTPLTGKRVPTTSSSAKSLRRWTCTWQSLIRARPLASLDIRSTRRSWIEAWVEVKSKDELQSRRLVERHVRRKYCVLHCQAQIRSQPPVRYSLKMSSTLLLHKDKHSSDRGTRSQRYSTIDDRKKVHRSISCLSMAK